MAAVALQRHSTTESRARRRISPPNDHSARGVPDQAHCGPAILPHANHLSQLPTWSRRPGRREDPRNIAARRERRGQTHAGSGLARARSGQGQTLITNCRLSQRVSGRICAARQRRDHRPCHVAINVRRPDLARYHRQRRHLTIVLVVRTVNRSPYGSRAACTDHTHGVRVPHAVRALHIRLLLAGFDGARGG